MASRKDWEPVLARLAPRLARDEVHADVAGMASVRYFYCTSVMGVVRLLRRLTRAKDVQAQHDVLKILFTRYVYGDRGKFETRRGIYRLDVVIDGGHHVIEVKTLVDMTIEKVRHAAMLATRQSVARNVPVDAVWIAFFYKFKGHRSPKRACKYILAFMALDLSGSPDMGSLNEQVSIMVQKSKKTVAEKLGVDNAIIIPVDNILLAEELERELKEMEEETDKIIEEKDQRIDALEDEVATKDKLLLEKEKALLRKDKALLEKDKALLEKDKALSENEREITRLRDELQDDRRAS